jgi:NTE family protein
MGGLIGGLFASGRNAEEIATFVNGIDWIDLLRGAPTYAELSLRRKEDHRTYPNEIELGWNRGVRFPGGLNAGHKAGLMLDRIAFPYSHIQSFDELPTPFRCVAADLIHMNEVVLKAGSLSRALRATMSIPGIFAPVKENGQMLVDGGLLNNLPTDVVREMGAGVVVAVDVGAPDPKELDLESFFGALSRSIDVMIQANVRRNLKLADIALHVELKGYGTFSFASRAAIIQRGYEAAEQAAQQLAPLSLSAASWDVYLQQRESRRRQEQIQPTFLAVEGMVPQDKAAAEKLLKPHLKDRLDFESLGEKLTKIVGWGRYEAAGYSQLARLQQSGLGIRARSKTYGPPFLKPSIEINGAQIDDVRFTLAARLTAYGLLGTDTEWRTDLSFGFRDLASTELYHRLGRTGLFVAPRAFASRRSQLVYLDNRRAAELAIDDQGFGLDVGYTTGLSHQIRLGYQMGQQRSRTRIEDPRVSSFKGRSRSLSAVWQFDRVNDAVVPTNGIRLQTLGQWFFSSPGAATRFFQAETRWIVAHPFKPRLSGFFVGRGGSTFGRQPSSLQQFTLGGPLQLGALGLQQLRGDHYFYSALGFIKLLSENPGGFIEKISAIGAYETGDAFDRKADPKHDVSAGILGRTRFGVLFFGGSLGEGGSGKIFFSLGSLF